VDRLASQTLVLIPVRRLREKNVGPVAVQTLPEAQIWS
jgi:hypothetical protein